MSAQLASSSAAQQHAVAHLANGTVTSHDTLSNVSQAHCTVEHSSAPSEIGSRGRPLSIKRVVGLGCM
jgi:hypothetical protein